MSDVLDQLASAPPPTPRSIAADLEAELKNLVPVKPRTPARQIATLVGISLVYGAGLLAVIRMRRDMSELPTPWIIGAGTAWLLGFVLPCYLALVPKPGSMMTRWPIAA